MMIFKTTTGEHVVERILHLEQPIPALPKLKVCTYQCESCPMYHHVVVLPNDPQPITVAKSRFLWSAWFKHFQVRRLVCNVYKGVKTS